MKLVAIEMLACHCPSGREAELIAQYLAAQELPEPLPTDEADVIEDDTLESVTNAHIRRVMLTSPSIRAAARRLDVNPATLHRRQQRERAMSGTD